MSSFGVDSEWDESETYLAGLVQEIRSRGFLSPFGTNCIRWPEPYLSDTLPPRVAKKLYNSVPKDWQRRNSKKWAYMKGFSYDGKDFESAVVIRTMGVDSFL